MVLPDHVDPPCIHRGSAMDPWWIHELVDALWIHVDPRWIHGGSFMDPWWIHVDSWTCGKKTKICKFHRFLGILVQKNKDKPREVFGPYLAKGHLYLDVHDLAFKSSNELKMDFPQNFTVNGLKFDTKFIKKISPKEKFASFVGPIMITCNSTPCFISI